MKRLVFYTIVMFYLSSCSSVNTVDEPDPDLTPGKAETEIAILLGMKPDSVQLGESARFSLKVIQNTPAKLFSLSIDTTGYFKLEIDDKDFHKVTSLLPDLNYNVSFTPLQEGYAAVTFNITGENGDTARQTIEIYTYTPETYLEFSAIPDSVSVLQPMEFRFMVKGIPGQKFTLKVDTVIPEFKIPLQNSVPGQNERIRRGVDLKINGHPLSTSIELLANYSNVLHFSNPQAIGNYHLHFTCTDQQGKETKATKTLHVFSPEDIHIQFYTVDPLNDLFLEKDRFYEDLNRHFSHDPLSAIFRGKETDSISWHIYPTEIYIWSVIGKGITFHIGQKGNDEFYFPADALTYEHTNATLKPEIDGQIIEQTIQKGGFHGLLFYYINARPYEATVTYRLTVYDYWGKKSSAGLTVHTL